MARQIKNLIRVLGNDPLAAEQMADTLRQYAELLTPWAQSAARYMLADVAQRNLRAWLKGGEGLSRGIRAELEQAPTGQLFAELMQQQVSLIRSLPLEAAEEVHRMTTAGIMSSERAGSLQERILQLGDVSVSRARLIARTEVSRTASTLTQARARHIGSEGYIWRTSGDGDVRDTHRRMNGKFVRWDSPPKTDKNLAPYHAGCGPNCRCYPDPVIPE